MKTYEIKDLLNKDLLIVELPRVCDYKLTKEMIFIMDKERSTNHRFKGSYTPLGKPDEIREEDAELLVGKVMYSQHFQNYKARKEKDFANLWCRTAKESLLSAIESEIFWENPYSIPSSDDINYFRNQKEENDFARYQSVKIWHEAEVRTFDRSRTLIFAKQ